MKTFVKLFTIAFALFLVGTQAQAASDQTMNSFDLAIDLPQEMEAFDVTTFTIYEMDGEEPECTVKVAVKLGVASVEFTVSGKCSEIAEAVNEELKKVVGSVKGMLKF